jgi:hypothetical protein
MRRRKPRLRFGASAACGVRPFKYLPKMAVAGTVLQCAIDADRRPRGTGSSSDFAI